ncbi:MAG: hypothetical protein KatS3mg121_0578 [Gammaproteobacteria bacterium]|nr:MAG: hypothetical protein KatS3mg121_0578 [Gammaproteobacteria bacterium]
MSEDKAAERQGEAPARRFLIERVYLKDLSFESPRPLETLGRPWSEPARLSMQVGAGHQAAGDGRWEVTLTVTVTAERGEGDKAQVLYLVEVKQAGLFQLEGFDEDERLALLNAHCPQILYPYAREVVSAMADRGGFPQLLLAPVDFQALYRQHLAPHLKQKLAEAQAAEGGGAGGEPAAASAPDAEPSS